MFWYGKVAHYVIYVQYNIFDYKISDEELLARAYTQVVSKNKSGKLLEEFRNSVKLAHSDYFESADVEIQEKFEAILKGVGLL